MSRNINLWDGGYVRNDTEYIDDAERAARTLRAAVGAAFICGLSTDNIYDIVSLGLDDFTNSASALTSQERMRRLGFYSDGALPDLPEPTDAERAEMAAAPRLFPNRAGRAA